MLGIDDVFPEEPADEYDPDTDWLERIDSVGPSTESFSLEAGEATVAVQIPWNKARDFLRKTLGFDYADKQTPWKLHREPAAWHPRFPWLIAATVDFSPVAPAGNFAAINITPDDPHTGTHLPNIYGAALPGGSAGWVYLRTAGYRKIWATVRFRDVPWTIRLDAPITSAADEITRNVFFTAEPSIEVLSAEGGNMLKFIEGSPSSSAATSTVPAPLGTLMAKTNFTMNWMHVPHDYISSDPDILIPINAAKTKGLLTCVGRVNSAAFGPFPAHTLLMQPPRFTRFRYPVASLDGIRQFFGWNVAVPLQHFDPDKGVADTPPGTSPYRGHQLMPYRIDLKWYMATRDGAAASANNTFLPEADFNVIFENVNS